MPSGVSQTERQTQRDQCGLWKWNSQGLGWGDAGHRAQTSSYKGVIVNYSVLYTWQFPRIDLKCSHHDREMALHEGMELPVRLAIILAIVKCVKSLYPIQSLSYISKRMEMWDDTSVSDILKPLQAQFPLTFLEFGNPHFRAVSYWVL